MNQASAARPQRRWLRTVVGSVVVIAIAAGLLAGIAYAKARQIDAAMSAPPPPEMPVAVTLATAQSTTYRRSSVVVGNVLAPESIRLRTELSGIVTEVRMIPGGEVQRGDVLLQLDDRTEQAQLKSAEASRKLADSALQRSQRLTNANANSASELDIAEAALARSEAAADELRVMIDKKKMRAPFRARVGLFDLHVGQYLVEGSEITTLEGIAGYLNIDFAMPSHVADAISIGDNVELRVGDAALPSTATIVAVDATADAISRSVTARARLDNPPSILQPRDSVHVTVYYGAPLPVRLVPATAVRRGPSGTVVFVAAEIDGAIRAQSRNVVVAGSDESMVRVIKGIEDAERVVADGSFKVHEGALLADVADVQKSAHAEPAP